jgi:hypothetical protein
MKLRRLWILLGGGQLIERGLPRGVFLQHQDHAVKGLTGWCASRVLFGSRQRMHIAGEPAHSSFIDRTVDAVLGMNSGKVHGVLSESGQD